MALTMTTVIRASAPREPCNPGEKVVAENELWSAIEPCDGFWMIANFYSKNSPTTLGPRWSELVYVAAFTIVWDPDYAFQCEAARKAYEEDEDDWNWEHSDDCEEFMCCVAGYERWQWLEDNMHYDDTWLGSLSEGDQEYALSVLAGDLVADTYQLHSVYCGPLSGWGQQLFGYQPFALPHAV